MLILNYIKKDKKIPAKLLKNFISLFKKPLIDRQYLKKELIHSAKETTLSLLITIGHDFTMIIPNDNSKISILPPAGISFIYEGQNKRKYTLAYLLDYYFTLLQQLNTDLFFKTIENKKLFIRFSYNALMDCLFDLPKKKQFTLYWYSIVVSAIGVGFGLFLNKKEYESTKRNEPRYYTEYLSSQTNRLCKKYKIDYKNNHSGQHILPDHLVPPTSTSL